MPRPGDTCARCKKREVEVIDDWVSDRCGHCNDRDFQRSEERRDFEYWHSDREKS